MRTEFGELYLVILCDSNREFTQPMVAPYKRANDKLLEVLAIHMFQKGVTTAEIAHSIKHMYSHHCTPQTFSNMTKVISEEVEALQNRTLHA